MKWKTLAAAAFLVFLSTVPVEAQTLTVMVTGSGKITGTGIDCGSDCSEAFPALLTRRLRIVVLTASGPGMGANGPSWGGVCSGVTGATCTVALSAGGATVAAAFATVSVPDMTFDIGSAMTLVSTEGPGTVSATVSGTTRTYRAEPSGGSSFAGWSGVCTGTNPVCTRSVSSVGTLKAAFGWPVTLTITGAGGRVTGPGIDCPTACHAIAIPPTLVLEAIAISSASLKEWGGDCKPAAGTASEARCSLSMTGPKNVSAQFEVKLPPPPPRIR